MSAKASDPDAGSDRQNDPSCEYEWLKAAIHGRRWRGVVALAYLLSRKLREVLVLEVLARVLAEHGVDKGVVDVAADTDGRVDLGELLDDEDRAGERGAGASVVGRSLDSHQLGGAGQTLSVSDVLSSSRACGSRRENSRPAQRGL